ncbi:MAG: M60 family metallopeptidase [Anaeroplasmataceae bacterium]|nr:M60 family metallopeptidase [Anaeroplasmataceae bacterium]
MPEMKTTKTSNSNRTPAKEAAKKNSSTSKASTAVKNTPKATPTPKSTEESSHNESDKKKVRLASGLTAVGFVILFTLVIVLILSVRSCSNSNEVYVNPYKTSTKVNYETEYLGTVKRTIPEVSNEGLEAYPKYGSTLKSVIGSSEEAVAKRDALITEARNLSSTKTRIGSDGFPQNTWDRMDKDGNLYLGDFNTPSGPNTPDKLYKHSSSIGLYLGDVNDDEPGVIKRITMGPRGYDRGYGITGLYAPAGEVVKIEMSKEDMDATGGIVIHIGQALYNSKANNIWTQKNVMNRFPVILNTLNVDKDTATFDEEKGIYTAYIGSFLGGPIYIRNESVTFSTVISGAVSYSHFILGYTTEEEFNKNAKTSTPYFDLEVWEYGVLHSGPKTYAEKFSYDQIYDAAVLWDKISLVSTDRSKQGIVFLYDPFVAAGAAVAFPGQGSVNCPMGWMTGSLNYEGLVSGGSWGNMHEYNHNFQGYGCGGGADGEVTNNALNIVEYSLFTKISSNRQIGSYGAAGLGGWNNYTSASWALSRINADSISSTNGLAVYATLLHNFGQNAFMKSAYGSGENYFVNWGNTVHYDMSYYAGLTNTFSSGNNYKESLHQKQSAYPMFVPVSSVYQTGRSYNYDGEKRYIETQQPFVINYGSEYEVDLSPYTESNGQYASGSVVIPNGFSYRIKSVNSKDVNGTFEKNADSDYIYTFKPNEETRSGKIYVTLEITKDDHAFEVEDVDLVLEFEQTHERTKTIVERTTYSYEEGKGYTSAIEAYNNNYAGYKEKKEADNINFTQNSNTDIWYAPKGNTQHPDHIVPDNSVVEVKGKLFFEATGKYRIALRGRNNCALYISEDGGKTFKLAAKIEDEKVISNSAQFRLNDENTYIDVEITEEESWIYYKTVLITQANDTTPYIGLGVSQWTTPTYTIQTTTDENGKEITKYFNAQGKEVTEAEASNTTPVAPTSMAYATAYRNSYVPNKTKFESDYFYKRTYSYDYKDNVYYKDSATLVSSENYSPWNKNDHKIENIVDGNTNTFMHTNYKASEQKPLVLTVDLGKEITANQMTMLTQYRPNGDYHYPTDFVLEGSLDGENFFEIGKFEGIQRTNTSVIANFEETQTFRYYRLTITKSSGTYIILSEIQFAKIFEINGGHKLSLDSLDVTMKGKWEPKSMLSSFGHVYVGKKNSFVEYEFEGTRFGILSSSSLGHDFEVYIDGEKIDSIELKEDTGTVMTYISSLLEQGKHKVIIKCTGNANIDSIVYWD